jgi:hypothetical protein
VQEAEHLLSWVNVRATLIYDGDSTLVSTVLPVYILRKCRGGKTTPVVLVKVRRE